MHLQCYLSIELSERQLNGMKLLYLYSMRTNVFNFSYFPCDPPYVTDELRKAEAFQDSMDKLKTEMEALQNKMMNSVPFYSSRYKVTKYFDHRPGF